MTNLIQSAAIILDEAAFSAQPVAQLSTQQVFSLEDAYIIQKASIDRRLDRGEKMVGYKLGFTSKAKMKQMGVHDLIWGRLTDKMDYKPGFDLAISDFIHPRAEPEIAFLIGKDINKPLDLGSVKDYIAGVSVAIEFIDSRYVNFKFSLEDVVADNCSSSGFCTGDWLPADTRIEDLPISLSIDGNVVEDGNSNAIMGNPWESAVEATRLVIANGETLKEGHILLAGAATPATFVERGQTVEAEADGLGKISINII